MPRTVVIMGPSGSGKTTIGKALARRLGWKFVEGDDFHSLDNRKKMATGTPLTDTDRAPWLSSVGTAISEAIKRDEDIVLACSALKESYRATLRVHEEVSFVFLDVPPEVLEKRLAARKGHFIPASLLPSQLVTLERPKDGIVVDAARPFGDVIDDIANQL